MWNRFYGRIAMSGLQNTKRSAGNSPEGFLGRKPCRTTSMSYPWCSTPLALAAMRELLKSISINTKYKIQIQIQIQIQICNTNTKFSTGSDERTPEINRNQWKAEYIQLLAWHQKHVFLNFTAINEFNGNTIDIFRPNTSVLPYMKNFVFSSWSSWIDYHWYPQAKCINS